MRSSGHEGKRGYDPIRDEWSRKCNALAFEEIWQPMGAVRYREMTGDRRMRDLDYGIDVELLRADRPSIMMAARFRGPQYLERGDITIRHRSLQTPGKALESAKATARYMTYAWANSDYHGLKKKPPILPTRLLDWVVVRLPELLDCYHDGLLKPKGEYPNDDGSSTLLAFALNDLYRQGLVFVRKGGMQKVFSEEISVSLIPKGARR